VFHGDYTLGGELLDLITTVLLPVLDVRVVADTEGTALKWISIGHGKGNKCN
jgi:hypothetical protein